MNLNNKKEFSLSATDNSNLFRDDLNHSHNFPDIVGEKTATIAESDFPHPATLNIDDNNPAPSNSLNLYLEEISRKPLLTLEEEQELAIRISKGDPKAKQIFIERNLRLVVSIAKNYQNRGLPLLDLIQEGNLGLMTAVDEYDITTGNKFSTYATYKIAFYIGKALKDKAKIIRLPANIYNKLSTIKKFKYQFCHKHGYEPTLFEIASATGLSLSQINKLSKLQEDIISLNTLIGNELKEELINMIADTNEPFENKLISNEIQSQVQNLLINSNLNQREIGILKLRYGFDDQEPMSLRQIGRIYNLSPTSIKNIEDNALRKIRKYNHLSNLRIYI